MRPKMPMGQMNHMWNPVTICWLCTASVSFESCKIAKMVATQYT